jgi:two-component system sensor histidine kinase HydH
MKFGAYHVQLMRYYDEVLTQSARNFAFTGDKKWELRYKTIEPLSTKLLKDAMENADGDIRPFFVKINETRAALVKLCYKAIDLVNKGNKIDAINLLEGQEYSSRKKILVEGLENLVSKTEANQEDNSVLSNVMSPSIQQTVDLERKMAVLEENVKKEKLFAIGELSARLAHDIRNPLSIIKNSIEMLIAKNDNIDPNTLEIYMRIQRAVDRISYQIDDVLNFVKPRIITVKKASLNEILKVVINRLRIPKTIKITLPQNDIEMVVDVINLEIVFVNLITNAVQAMDNSGEIEIQSHENGDIVTIKISDSGPGIPNENISKVFEPLFTTKQTGTGLGLVSCKTIIEQHGGSISVESPVGSGAIFTIRLPLKQAE